MKTAKKALSILLTALLLLSALSPLALLEIAAKKSDPYTISYLSPAIPANLGETVDLTAYALEFTSTLTYQASEITWSSSDVTLQNGKFTPSKTGVFKLTARASGRTKTVYLVVKSSGDSGYLLYEENFEAVGATVESLGYSVIQKTGGNATSVTIRDGRLVLSGHTGDHYIRVLLPEWLGEFGNYRIETDAAMTAAQGSTRWMGVMFRIQNNNYPYYQMTGRYHADASNGTELALRNAKDAWEVQYKTPYSEKLTDHALRTYTVEAYGSSMRTSIDGKELVATSGTSLTAPGRIGFHLRGAEMSVDSIRVYLQLEEPENTSTYMAEIEDPMSNVILPPSAVTEIDSASALEDLTDALKSSTAPIPTTAVFSLDSTLKLNIPGNAKTVAELLTLLDERVIPAFRIENASTATALTAELERLRVHDVFIVSSNVNTLKAATNSYLYARAVLDASDGDPLKTYGSLAGIRAAANQVNAHIVILPEDIATKANVEALQRLLISVWAKAADTETARVRAIVSGANGVVTKDFTALTAAYTKYFLENTVIRPVSFIGHRGIPSLAPENTVAGSLLAYDYGATFIELDVYVSTDGVAVVMHDKTIDRTTDGTGNVEDYSYEELCDFVVDTHPSFGDEPIPTLEDYFKAFKGLDAILLIEVKTSKTEICTMIADLVRKYEMQDQVNVISFGTSILLEMKRVMPELSVGFLTSTIEDDENDPTASVERILETVQTYEATYNPSYNGSTPLGPNLITAANHRGIFVLPWTVNSKTDLDRYYFYGSNAITTNYMQYVSDVVKTVDTAKSSYRFSTDKSVPIPAIATTYNRDTSERTHGTLVLVEGDDVFTYQNGVLTASKPGKATVMLSVCCLSIDGELSYLYTTPFTVEALDPSIVIPEDETTESPTPDTVPGETTAQENGTTEQPPVETDPQETVADTAEITEPQGAEEEASPETDQSAGCSGTVSTGGMIITIAVPLIFPPILRKRRRHRG